CCSCKPCNRPRFPIASRSPPSRRSRSSIRCRRRICCSKRSNGSTPAPAGAIDTNPVPPCAGSWSNADPSSATKADLKMIRSHGNGMESPCGRLIENIAALNVRQCEMLCRFAEAHMTSVVPDTVDDLPEYQVNLSVEGLTELLGRDTVAALLKMPEALGAPSDVATRDLYERIDIFVRMYSPRTRPYIAFHSDTSSYTINIALNDDSGFDGGKLLAVNGTTLKAPLHSRGTAILHTGNVVH